MLPVGQTGINPEVLNRESCSASAPCTMQIWMAESPDLGLEEIAHIAELAPLAKLANLLSTGGIGGDQRRIHTFKTLSPGTLVKSYAIHNKTLFSFLIWKRCHAEGP
jgi:hypothetical protein